MALEKITRVAGRAVNVPGNDIDTDRIIPARYLKCVTFDGLGEFLFYDVRKNADGSDKPHPLNEPRHKGATILLSGANFGCGSSREHAPQALQKYGIRGVIAEGFAEIFHGNSTTLGMPCVTASREDIARIAAAVEADPSTEVVIDLVNLRILFAGQSVGATLRESARDALVNGRWDPIGELLEGAPDAVRVAGGLRYMSA
jgi:3-isopropylmalate/(R)-2-methylmalate dehydratase small subunit